MPMPNVRIRLRPARKSAVRLSEAASDNPKRKRGRPKAWHGAPQAARSGETVPALESGGMTERGAQEHRLAWFALWAMDRRWEPAFAWFFSRPPCSKEEAWKIIIAPHPRGRSPIRWTVLAEVGRFHFDEDILEIARVVSTWPTKIRARAAAGLLRDFRLKRGAFADAPEIERIRIADFDAPELEHDEEHEERVAPIARRVG